MRTLFTLFGGLSIIGAIMDGALLALLGLAVMAGLAGPEAGVAGFHRYHLPALPGVASAVGDDPFHPLLLALPALLYFPVRIILGLMTGAAALAASRTSRRL